MGVLRGTAAIVGCMAILVADRTLAAWEVELVGELSTRAVVVRLADIGTVREADRELQQLLSDIIVAPGPTRSRVRVLSNSDIRKAVERRGIDMLSGRFSGASRVVVRYGEPSGQAESQATRGQGIPNSQLLRAKPRRVEAVTAARHTDLPAAQRGTPGALVAVVVAVREIGKGQLVQPDDVTLREVPATSAAADTLRHVEDAVGREALRVLQQEQLLTTGMLRQPLLVRKRDEVDVCVRCGVIRAKRKAVAQNDGGLGDVVLVSFLGSSRAEFSARVVGVRTVEVLANSTGVTAHAE